MQVVRQIYLRQCGDAIDTRIKGFGRLWLVYHGLRIVLKCTCVSQCSLVIRMAVALAAQSNQSSPIIQHVSLRVRVDYIDTL